MVNSPNIDVIDLPWGGSGNYPTETIPHGEYPVDGENDTEIVLAETDCLVGDVECTEDNSPCPEGYIQDVWGNCEEKPCPGDPVPNPEIAPQTNSGMAGGLFGTCTRDHERFICAPKKRKHQGVDILNAPGKPIFAMYDGVARQQIQYDDDGNLTGAGYHIAVTSQVDGKTVRHVYFHLQQANQASGPVKAGDIIGYQGDSGNLKSAIEDGLTQSHVHVKVEENGEKTDPLTYFKTKIDSETGELIQDCNAN